MSAGMGEEEPAGAPGAGASRSTRRSSVLVSAGILVSRVSGLARERAMSHFLGTGIAADAFTAAFRIPNLLQNLLGEGVLSASFIPVYSRLLSEGREREAGRVAGAIAGLLAAAAGAISLLGFLLAEPLTHVIAAGFAGRPETFALTATLVRILFPAVGLLVLSAWCLGVLNSHRRFFLSYVAPAMLNVAQIAVLVVAGSVVLGEELAASPDTAQVTLVRWLAIGTVAGGLLQFLIQLPVVLRVSGPIPLSLSTSIPGVGRVLRAFAPIVSARGVVQLSAYLQVLLASFLAAGALATLRYAQILYLLPISLFGMAVAAAELPELSRADAQQSAAAADRLRRGLERIATFVVPTMLGYLVVGDAVVGALFQTGEFSAIDTVAVWIVLAGYALGLQASTSARLLQSALYGGGDSRTPAVGAVARVAIGTALGVVLMLQLDRVAVTGEGLRLLGDLPALGPLPEAARDETGGGRLVRLGAAGLSLATAVGAWAEVTILRRRLRRDIGAFGMRWAQWRPLLAGAAAALVAAVAMRPSLAALGPLSGGLVTVATVAAAYLTVAWAAGNQELRTLMRGVGRRLGR